MGRVRSTEEVDIIKEDFKKLERWSNLWQMQFNVDKCKVMHLGKHNLRVNYQIEGTDLIEVNEEKDLGVIFDDTFKVGNQCLKAAKKGNQILGMIKRTFTCKNRKVVLNLYKSLVRPHLEYCVQAWRPHFKKDIDCLEKIQRRATRMIEGYGKVNYDNRLKQVGLTTLETRRERADMLEVYKIMKGLEGLHEKDFFIRDNGKGRGHEFKLYKKRVRLDCAKYSFGNRICKPWNSLPCAVVEAPNINLFKGRLGNFLSNIRGFK